MLSLAAIFYGGGKMFKLAHSLVVNPLSTCAAADDVQDEAWCAQGEHGGANHAHCTVAVTKHFKHRPFNSLHACFCVLVHMWELKYWYLVYSDLWPPQVAFLCSSDGCCNIFWHQGGGDTEGNLLRALNVEVIFPHPPRATAFEVFGEFWGPGRTGRWWIHRKHVFHNTLDTSGEL